MAIRASRKGVYRRAVLDRFAYPFTLARYTFANLPPAAQWTGASVVVSDESGGETICISDGTEWRRQSDLASVTAFLPTGLSAAGAATAILESEGIYLDGTGAATANAVGEAIAAVAISAAGLASVTLQTPPFGSSDLSVAGASTVTGVGSLGEGEDANMTVAGITVATGAGQAGGEPSALSATAQKCVALFEGVAA